MLYYFITVFIASHFGDSLAWVLLREVSLTLILAMIFHAVIDQAQLF